MATYTAVAAGGDWNVSTTWSPAGVPGALDTAILNSASGNVTVPAAGSTCATLTINGYLGTLLLNGNLTIATSGLNLGSFTGTINFNAGDIILPDGLFNLGNASVYTTLGTGGVRITKPSASFSIFNTNNKIWNCKFALAATGSTSPTIYFEDNPLEVTGLVSFQATTTGTYNLISADIFTPNLVFLKMSGDFTISGSTIYTTTTSGQNIGFTGSANQTLTASGTHQLRCPLIINKTGGVLTLSGTLNYNTGTLAYVASGGTVNAGSSTLNIGASATLNTNGITWNNISAGLTFSNPTITLSSNLTWSGTMSLINNTLSVSGATRTVTFSGSSLTSLPTANIDIGNTGFASFGGASIINFPSSTVLSITNLNIGCGGFASGAYNTSANNVTFNISGNLTLNTSNGGFAAPRFNGTSSQINIIGNSTITNNRISGTSTYIAIPTFTINTPNTVTFSSTDANTVYFESSTITYTSGTLTGATCAFITSTLNLNAGGKWGTDVNIRGNTTLTSNATFGNLTTSTNNVGFTGAFTINVEGNLVINVATSGAASFVINGNGSQSWTHGSAVYLSNSLTINKTSGTLTIGTLALPNIYYNTGTLTDNNIGGTVNASTNSSTLNINSSCTLNTSSITWYNITNNATQTLTLTSNLVWSNNWNVTAGTISFANIGTLSPSSTANVNFSGSSIINLKNNIQITNATFNTTTINTNTISVSGNLTVSGSTSGTTTTNINGSGSQTWTSTAYLSAPLTIAKTVGSTLLLSANTYYGTGTLTYVSGTIDSTTNSNTLNLTGSPSLNTLGTTWNKVAFSNVTITLLSDFTATGLVTITTGNPLVASINGVGRKFYANGGMTVNSTTIGNSKLTGTAELRFEGTGYWTAVATGNFCTWYQIDTVINPTGNFFIDTRFISNKITYSNSNGGTITSANLWIGTDASGNSVSLGGMTLDTNDLIWNSITYFIHWNASGATSTLTSLSNINCKYWIFYNVGTGTGINVNYSFPSGGNISNTETFYVANRTIVNLPTNANFETDNLYFSNGGAAITGSTQLNNGTVVVKRVLEKQDAFNSSFGTTLIKFANNSSWSNLNGGISFVMEILGNVTFNGNSYSQATLKYTGNINSPIAKGTLNITANCALTNMHKLTFNNLVITSGTTMTMNEFFSGLPNKNSIVGASSTSNFNVTFTDNFEKIAKFINVNGVTFTRPQQLLLLTNQPKKSRNIGIRYNNDLPNGIPKGDPSVQNLQTVGQSRTLLLGDPAFVKSI